MIELIGQDIDTLMKSAQPQIKPITKSIAFSDKVAADFKEMEMIKVTNQNNQIYMVVGGVALLALIGGVYYYYRQHKKKTNDSIAKQKEELSNLKSEFHSFFEEAKRRNTIRPVKMVLRERDRRSPYFET